MHSNHFGSERILCIQHRVSLQKHSLSAVNFIFGFGTVCLSTAGQYIYFIKGRTSELQQNKVKKKSKEKVQKTNVRQDKTRCNEL